MAKQAGTFHITGCIDNLCFYEMDGQYYVRMKNSLTGKRVKKDPRFKRTMQYAALLASASKIASVLYRELPKEEKGIVVYRALTGRVMKLLQKGKSDEEAAAFLTQRAKQTKPVNTKKAEQPEKITVKPYTFADEIINRLFLEEDNCNQQEEERHGMFAETPP